MIETFARQNEGTLEGNLEFVRHVPENRRHVGNKIPILGSKDRKFEKVPEISDFLPLFMNVTTIIGLCVPFQTIGGLL